MNRLTKALFFGVWLMILPVNLDAVANCQRFYSAGTAPYIADIRTQRFDKENYSKRVAVIALEPGENSIPAEAEGEINRNPEPRTAENNGESRLEQAEAEKQTQESIENTVKNPKRVSGPQKPAPQQPPDMNAANAAKGEPENKNLVNNRPATAQPGDAPLKIETILATITDWWLSNPVNLQIWHLFFLVGLVFYLFKLRNLRRPLLFLSIIVLGFYLGNSLDPIGAVFNVIPRPAFTFDNALILSGIAVALSLLFGRFYCGWLCPLGAVQEFIHPEANIAGISAPMDKLLKSLKYPVLLIFLYLSWQTGKNLWTQYDPLSTLVHFKEASFALFLLILLFLVSVIIERPFCRYICPLGAILSLTSRIAPFKMRSDAAACMVCGKCTTGDCPMNSIEAPNPAIDLPKIDGSECIHCLDCQNICQRTALRVSLRRIDRVM